MSTTQQFTAHYIGLQERLNKPPLPLVNVRQTTAMYRPRCHVLRERDKRVLRDTLLQDLRSQRFLSHLQAHWQTLGREKTEYLCQFFRLQENELQNWFDILLELGLIQPKEEKQKSKQWGF